MKVYCLNCNQVCDKQTLKITQKVLNGDIDFERTGVILGKSIQPSVGHPQFININPHSSSPILKRHYPDVDIFRCPNCGTIVCIE